MELQLCKVLGKVVVWVKIKVDYNDFVPSPGATLAYVIFTTPTRCCQVYTHIRDDKSTGLLVGVLLTGGVRVQDSGVDSRFWEK